MLKLTHIQGIPPQHDPVRKSGRIEIFMNLTSLPHRLSLVKKKGADK
jgi:hypothetical protein